MDSVLAHLARQLLPSTLQRLQEFSTPKHSKLNSFARPDAVAGLGALWQKRKQYSVGRKPYSVDCRQGVACHTKLAAAAARWFPLALLGREQKDVIGSLPHKRSCDSLCTDSKQAVVSIGAASSIEIAALVFPLQKFLTARPFNSTLNSFAPSHFWQCPGVRDNLSRQRTQLNNNN